MLPDNPTHNRLETNKPTLQKNQGGSLPDKEQRRGKANAHANRNYELARRAQRHVESLTLVIRDMK